MSSVPPFNEFGYKRLTLENWLTVDPAWLGVVMSPSRPNPSEAWVYDLVQTELDPAVPLSIRKLFEIARGTLVSSLMFYPLLTLGTEQMFRVRAHIGAEVAVSDLGQRLRPAKYLPHQHPIEPVRLPLLVESRAGYKNLCRLTTHFKLRESTKAEGSALTSDFEKYSEGLVCLTGGSEGPLAAALAGGGYDAARQTVEQLVNIFGPRNVYVELQRHSDREEEHRNRAAIRIARSLNLPLLATGGVNYATEYERVSDVIGKQSLFGRQRNFNVRCLCGHGESDSFDSVLA